GGERAQASGDPAQARPLVEESVALFRRLDERWGLGLALSFSGVAISRLGEVAPARAALEESLAVLRPIGDGWATAIALGGLGLVLVSQGDYAGAEGRFEESLAIVRSVGGRVLGFHGWTGPGGGEGCPGERAGAAGGCYRSI